MILLEPGEPDARDPVATRERALAASTPRNRSGKPTFWATVFQGKIASRWNTKPRRGFTPATA
jgi:hypothetical protein